MNTSGRSTKVVSQGGRRGGGHERSPYRTQHGGATITLRIKPDRRCIVTWVDPDNERRRR